ncbi:MAG TPA: sensor histidine kinase [Bryobacteraceae bacterium]|nr:sensor histidine kinase [Bryobacteraceae bacterium]
MWRRHLGVVRALLAVACVAIYVLYPVSYGFAVALITGLYCIYSIFILIRNTVESIVYPIPILALDVLFFFLCALHPSQAGVWLSTVTYFYLLCMSALLYSYVTTAGVVFICLSFFMLVRPIPAYVLWPAVLLGGVLAVVLSIQKRTMQERLSAALKRSVISRSEAETARESERQRIAADFHDGPLQSFISFQMRLEIIRKLFSRDPDAALSELLQLQELGKSQVTDLRSFLRNMQPIEVDNAGLSASIRQAVAMFERDSGISTTLVCGELPEPEEPDMAAEILQIIREALNNVRKHSKASRVTMVIDPLDDAIQISVEDDGSGFPFSGAYSLDELEMLRLGPRSIKRRIRTLGGELHLESRPSQGAELKIRIPT